MDLSDNNENFSKELFLKLNLTLIPKDEIFYFKTSKQVNLKKEQKNDEKQ